MMNCMWQILGTREQFLDGELWTLEGKKKSVVAERLSDDHNVAVEEVRKELEALHPDDAHIVVYTRGVWRVKGIIQVWHL